MLFFEIFILFIFQEGMGQLKVVAGGLQVIGEIMNNILKAKPLTFSVSCSIL